MSDNEKKEESADVGNSSQPEAPVNSIESTLREELEKTKSEMLYLKADFENYKRRAIKERADMLKYAGERLSCEILNVIDDFERSLAMEVNADNFATFRMGIDMIAKQLSTALRQFGIEEIPSQGMPFDPNIHEALASQESNEVQPGHVLQTLKKPYKMHDKIIRPGQVIVAKAASTQN